MGKKIDEFVALYDSVGVDFAYQELLGYQFLIFIESDTMMFKDSDRAPHIKFDENGDFVRMQL